jgi:hypothetical protein
MAMGKGHKTRILGLDRWMDCASLGPRLGPDVLPKSESNIPPNKANLNNMLETVVSENSDAIYIILIQIPDSPNHQLFHCHQYLSVLEPKTIISRDIVKISCMTIRPARNT